MREIVSTYAGGGGWLADLKGKLPIPDRPPTKGYPSGGEVAKQYGDYKTPSSRRIKIQVPKAVKKPISQQEVPDMDLIEEKAPITKQNPEKPCLKVQQRVILDKLEHLEEELMSDY